MRPFPSNTSFTTSATEQPRASESVHSDLVSGLKQGLLLGLAVAALILPPGGYVHPGTRASTTPAAAPRVFAMQSAPASVEAQPGVARHADFGSEEPSPDARSIADWIADSHDNQKMSFVILDKRGARVYVFDPGAKLIGTTMVLLGSAVGDDTLPGVGDKPLSAMRPEERTTPAGRFVSEPGHDSSGDDVIWVDYAAAVAMHRVKVIDPKERRFERIATPSAEDKRISNGCINVPIAFFDNVVKPAIGGSKAVIYVLPDVKPLREVFAASYDVNSRAGDDDPIAQFATATADSTHRSPPSPLAE